MATMTTSLTVPSFASLKASSNISKSLKTASLVGPTKQCSPRLAVRASLKDNLGLAVAATAAAATLLASGGAMAFDVTLGSDDGGLVFLPAVFEVASGEKITFTNNAGFPHNVVFDEDEIPSGVDASKISMSEEDLLNAKGETYAVTLTEKGTYSFYCSPHQGAGMVGKVTVK